MAMRFSFRLETVLNWKRSLEEISQLKLSQKVRQFREQEAAIGRLTGERLAGDRQLIQRCQGGIEATEYLFNKEFAEESYRELLSREDEKRSTLREIDQERESLVSLMKERKILEKLKEKKLKEFTDRIEKSDQKAMDERSVVQSRQESPFREKI
jgi:flagellar protein FliJ